MYDPIIESIKERINNLETENKHLKQNMENLEAVDGFLYSMVCLIVPNQETLRMMANAALPFSVDPAMKKAIQEITGKARKLRNQKNQNTGQKNDDG